MNENHDEHGRFASGGAAGGTASNFAKNANATVARIIIDKFGKRVLVPDSSFAKAARQGAGVSKSTFNSGEYVDEDSFETYDEFVAALPKYDPTAEGPEGQTVTVSHPDTGFNGWLAQEHSADGVHVGNKQYASTKADALVLAAQLQNAWNSPTRQYHSETTFK